MDGDYRRKDLEADPRMLFLGCKESTEDEEPEELTWIESQFKGLIIGKQQKTLRYLEVKTNAKVFKERDSIFVQGTKDQKDEVKDIIRRKIIKASTEGEEEIADYIPDDLVPLIIGEKCSGLDKIYQETGAFLYLKSRKIVMKGSSQQKEIAHAAIKDKLKSAECSEGYREVVDYIPENLVGLIIGKRGSTARKIFEDTGALVVTSEGKIILRGSSEQRRSAHAAIKDILDNAVKREVFATEADAKYIFLNAGQDSEGNINYLLKSEEPKHKFNFDFKNMPELEQYVLEQIQILNKKAKTKNALAHLYLHVGKLFVSMAKEEIETDVFTVEDIRVNLKKFKQPWNFRFESACDELSTKKLDDLPSFQSFVRYDFNIGSPTGYFIYKVYMKEENKKGQLEMNLCSPEDLAVSLQRTCATRIGPGHLWRGKNRSCRADILLPKEFVARFNIDTVYPEDQDQTDEVEKNTIIEHFCKKLTVASIVNNANLPKLPNGYSLDYFRQCRRTEYEFSPNILVVSREREIINLHADRVKNQTDLVDIRLLNTDLNQILETTTWSVEDVMEKLPEYFGFVGRIFDYLGK